MQLRTRMNSNMNGSIGRRSGAVRAVVVVVLFAVVLVGLLIARPVEHAPRDQDSQVRATPVARAAVPEQPAPVPAPHFATETATDRQPIELAKSDPVDASAEPSTEAPAVDASEARRQRLVAQLEAGEFGPALETAESAGDPEERTELLKAIADAQMNLNEFRGAQAAIRRMPLSDERAETENERAARQSLAGGGPDYDALKDLIMNVVTGENIFWEEVDGEGGTIDPFELGVRVDPNGVLQQITRQEQDNRLRALGINARLADLNDDMARPSPLRLVSLTRLEAEISRRMSDGLPVVSTMKHLAGLSRVEYVFVYPEAGEVVIGGPAEGWRYNETGNPVGVESGRPTLQLDDLVTVLRIFSEDGSGLFSCTIEPRQEGLERLNEFVARTNRAGPLEPAAVRHWARQLQERLGLQDVGLTGVPEDSRVARVIVEADYRMKLIGIGKLDGGADIPSYFELLPKTRETKTAQNINGLRWWLTMKYDALMHSPERDVFAVRGPAVRCQSEDVLVDRQGERTHTGQASSANRLFAQNFTEHYAQLAAADPIFADLQNVFDLSLVAALIRQEQLCERIGWDLGVFSADGQYQPASYEPPKTAMSVVNHRVFHGKDVVVQVAGGVVGDTMSVVRNPQIVQQATRLAGMAEQNKASELPEGRWWWDAAK